MAWLEKLFINFSAHLSTGRCDSLLSQSLSCDFWAGRAVIVFRAIMCFALFVTNEIYVITLRIGASWQTRQCYSSHRDYFRSAAVKCYFLFVNTMGFHDDNSNTLICVWVLYLQLPNPLHLSSTPLTIHNQSSTWNNCMLIMSHFMLGEKNFYFNKVNLWVRNKLLIQMMWTKIVCHIHAYMYVCVCVCVCVCVYVRVCLESFWKEI